MATLERSRDGGERVDLDDRLGAGAPSAFPVDELVALRNRSGSQEEAGSGPVERRSELREQPLAPTPRNPFADEARSADDRVSSLDEHHHPPSYTDEDLPVPDYQEHATTAAGTDEARLPTSRSDAVAGDNDDDFHPSGVSLLTEKRRQDFTHLSDAIDRLNVVAPQLDNQRVALGEGKASELELARLVGRGRMDDQYATVGSKGKARAEATETAAGDEAELHEIWQRIEKAHGRRIDGQDSAPVDPDQFASAEARRRSAFMDTLADRNDAGRLDDQDWTASRGSREASDLLTVDQFIQEDSQAASSSSRAINPSHSPSPRTISTPDVKRLSGSAASARRSSLKDGYARLVNRTGSPADEEVRRRSGRSFSPSVRKGVSYVAEFQRNIRIVQVSLYVPEGGDFHLGVSADDAQTAILVPSNSTAAPLRLLLPTEVQPQTELLVQPSLANTYSFRLQASAQAVENDDANDRASVAYSADSLASILPRCLQCATCDASLVDCTAVQPADYSGLPSEHWEELIGSWLCHDEMKLDLGSEGAGGVFWPQRSEVLVGGTYLMLKESLMVPQSWLPRPGGETELWQPLVCSSCNAPIGRRSLQPHPTEPSSTIKLHKYAIRLPDQPPPPFLAFICQDLLELADSHRSYHFILEAEEAEGRPQLLIWLFNTSVSVTSTPEAEASPSVAPTRAAKVLYAHLSSVSQPPALPATFPTQTAETLSYPAAVIDRLAAELQRHNGAFPPAARHSMGLDVAWMERF